MHSQRQLYTIKTFARKDQGQMSLHSGCFGCGKTYCLAEGLGKHCLDLRQIGLQDLNYILLGKTQQSVKKNICNVLTSLYGKDFKYDSSRSSGTIRDARLFDQNIHIIGLNDSSSESKFRGISNIDGILHDEAVLCSKEQFDYIIGRLRGQHNPKIPDQIAQHWYIGSTNPDVPTHFLLDYKARGIIRMVKWYMRDACWDGAEEYYKRLKLLYKDNPSFYDRYLLGHWTSSDRMVYPNFNIKRHVVDTSDVDVNYASFKSNFLGVDYGGDHPTAITLISLNYQNIYIVSKEWKLRNTAPSDIVQKIAEIIDYLVQCGTYCEGVYVDPSAKGLKDELTKKGITWKNAANSHQDGIGKIRTLLSTDRLYILNSCEDLVVEMFSYKYKDTTNGKDEVIKVNDDLVDSMRYGIYTHSLEKGV